MVKYLKTPISEAEIRELQAGDTDYVSGLMVTARDDAHKRIVCEGIIPEIDLKGAVLYHAGPIIERQGDAYNVLACGPTTSMRMEPFEAEFAEKTGIRLAVGKGGMGEKTAAACVGLGFVHGIYPGGCAVTAAESIIKVKQVIWEDLGMPEAMWVYEAENFGPITINIDTKGGNLMERQKKEYRERAERAQRAERTESGCLLRSPETAKKRCKKR